LRTLIFVFDSGGVSQPGPVYPPSSLLVAFATAYLQGPVLKNEQTRR